jgi:hypothetical protein
MKGPLFFSNIYKTQVMKPGRFFSTTLSSHIVPVIFAISILFIAERKISGEQTAQRSAVTNARIGLAQAKSQAPHINTVAVSSNTASIHINIAPVPGTVIAESSANSGTESSAISGTESSAASISALGISPAMFAFGGVANIQQVVAISRVSGLLMKIIR